MSLDLTDDEAAAFARYLRQKLDDERFPSAPRLDPVKAILAKLDNSIRRHHARSRYRRFKAGP